MNNKIRMAVPEDAEAILIYTDHILTIPLLHLNMKGRILAYLQRESGR